MKILFTAVALCAAGIMASAVMPAGAADQKVVVKAPVAVPVVTCSNLVARVAQSRRLGRLGLPGRPDHRWLDRQLQRHGRRRTLRDGAARGTAQALILQLAATCVRTCRAARRAKSAIAGATARSART